MVFKDKYLEAFWNNPADADPKRIPRQLRRAVYRRLQMLDAAHELRDLAVPPGNRLEALRAERKGQYSIRVNDQWRICFLWTHEGAKEVELCDYH